MRALLLLAVAACSVTPAPPPAAPPQPAQPVEHVPSWVGVRLDEGPPRITQVIKDAPADRAGLRIGDEIRAVDGEPIASGPAFVERVKRTRNGDTLAIAVVRGGGRITLDVRVEPRPISIATSALIGKPAPLFAAAKLSGAGSTNLVELRGKVVVVDFWATWCGPCAMTIPRLGALHEQLAGKGLHVVGLSSEDPATIRHFVADRAIGYDIGHDPEDKIAAQYLREGIPMFVVIDRAGVVRDVIVGADMDAVEQVVAPLL